MSILKVEKLVKTYGSGDAVVKALDSVSFSVEKGEFIAVTGQSGSGKSTLLHMIAGIDKPDSGNIIVDGKDILKLSNKDIAEYRRKEVSLIYQFYNLVPVLNVSENITISDMLINKKIDKIKLDTILKQLNLENRKKHFPNQLSGGQQQRTAVGRVVYTSPKILLADEPTGNLDSKNSHEIIEYFKWINKEYNQTIILITHDISIAKQAKRIISIEDGTIISDEAIR